MPDPSSADQARTKSTYGLQWNRFRIIRDAEDRATFHNRTGLRAGELAGASVLDGGCGMGRYLRVAAADAGVVVGVDLSEAVRAARDQTREFPNVAVVRGDLLQLPFRMETFDHVYSIGVLDHTPDPRSAFLSLARMLKPGGRISIWVYRRESPIVERIMNAHRAISTRLPLGLLLWLCRVTAPLGLVKRWLMASRWRLMQRVGVALHALTIGVSMHPDAEVRVCDTLDWYAPKYLSRHTFEEVAGWFADAGLVDVVDLSVGQVFHHEGQGNGVNLAGRRPSPA